MSFSRRMSWKKTDLNFFLRLRAQELCEAGLVLFIWEAQELCEAFSAAEPQGCCGAFAAALQGWKTGSVFDLISQKMARGRRKTGTFCGSFPNSGGAICGKRSRSFSTKSVDILRKL